MAALMQESSGLWVFGYGSLIWNPGFDHDERAEARLAGFHRSLSVRSHVHRGTPERPGLVFGLDRGGSCVGMAFHVPADKSEAAIAYLRERELVTHVYRETRLRIRLRDGRGVGAVTYVVDRGHSQYAGKLSVQEAAAIVSRAHGKGGPNVDYVRNALIEIHRLGLRDRWLEDVVRHLPGQAGTRGDAHDLRSTGMEGEGR